MPWSIFTNLTGTHFQRRLFCIFASLHLLIIHIFNDTFLCIFASQHFKWSTFQTTHFYAFLHRCIFFTFLTTIFCIAAYFAVLYFQQRLFLYCYIFNDVFYALLCCCIFCRSKFSMTTLFCNFAFCQFFVSSISPEIIKFFGSTTLS